MLSPPDNAPLEDRMRPLRRHRAGAGSPAIRIGPEKWKIHGQGYQQLGHIRTPILGGLIYGTYGWDGQGGKPVWPNPNQHPAQPLDQCEQGMAPSE